MNIMKNNNENSKGTLKGSCLCQAVVYELTQLDMPIWICHCQTCRKANAASEVATAGVQRSHFRLLCGEEKLTAFESSPGKLRYFCSVCGSHLFSARDGQTHVILRVATLDTDPGLRPLGHIWTSQDQPWLDGSTQPCFAERSS